MKKVLFSYLLLFCCVIYSQNKILFSEINKPEIDLSGSYKNYRILRINEEINSLGHEEILTLTYDRDYVFELQENRLFSDTYEALIKKENTVEHKNLEELNFDGKYFLNADRSSNHQLALSLFDGQYSFYVKSSGKEFYIEPLRRFNKQASLDEYVYYEVSDIISDPLSNCGVENKKTPDYRLERNEIQQTNTNCKTLEMNFCVDYSFYANCNYNINNTINKTFEIMNLCQLDYTVVNGLAYDVNFKLKRHYILTCTNCNYWSTTDDLSLNNSYFAQYANYTQIFDTKADVKVFWEYSTVTQNAFGYGAQGGLTHCDPNWTLTTTGTASVRLTGDTNNARKVLSHELGHNFGCEHIQDGINIMNSGGYAGHTWNPTSIAIINSTLASTVCFSDCQSELCDNKKIENLTASVDNSNSRLNVSWLSEVGMEYKLRLYSYNTNTWSSYSTVSYPQNSFALPYTDTVACGNRYKMEITPVCSGISGFTQLVVFNSNVTATYPGLSFLPGTQLYNFCTGYTYTFSVHVMYPGNNPTYQWKINDILVGTNSPDFTSSAFVNNDRLVCYVTSNDPCVVNPSSSIVLTLSVSSNYPCTLSNAEFDLDAISYYPNPVKDQFTIKSQSEIKSISIFNIIGQRLFQNTIVGTESTLDLSNYPRSTYMVKIDFDGSSKTIKIIKE